jgi:hypothetical protein
MKGLIVLGLVAFACALSLPADAASPPKKEIARLKREVAALKAEVAALSVRARQLKGENTDLSDGMARSFRAQNALSRRIAQVDPCAITRPNRSEPPGSTFGGPLYHGNGAIWVGLGTANVNTAEPDQEGSLRVKFGWWRGVSGQLRIEGRRLDAPGAPLRADVPSGYGPSGFQSSALFFPVEGCWEVTAHAGSASLSFVTLVLAAT